MLNDGGLLPSDPLAIECVDSDCGWASRLSGVAVNVLFGLCSSVKSSRMSEVGSAFSLSDILSFGLSTTRCCLTLFFLNFLARVMGLLIGSDNEAGGLSDASGDISGVTDMLED